MESAHIRYHESLVQSKSSPAGSCDVILESEHQNVQEKSDHQNVQDNGDPEHIFYHESLVQSKSLSAGSCDVILESEHQNVQEKCDHQNVQDNGDPEHIFHHESLVQSKSSSAGSCDIILESEHQNVQEKSDPQNVQDNGDPEHFLYHESLVQSKSSPAGDCDVLIVESDHQIVQDKSYPEHQKVQNEGDPGAGSDVHQIPPSLECGSCGLTFSIPGGDLHAAMLVHIQNPVHKLAMRGEAFVRRKNNIPVNVSEPVCTQTTTADNSVNGSGRYCSWSTSVNLLGIVSPPYRTRSTGAIYGNVTSRYRTRSTTAHLRQSEGAISSTASAQELPPSNALSRPLPLNQVISNQTVRSPLDDMSKSSSQQEEKSKKRLAICDINPNPKRGYLIDLTGQENLFLRTQVTKMISGDGTIEVQGQEVCCRSCQLNFSSTDITSHHIVFHMFGKRHFKARWKKKPSRHELEGMISAITETKLWLKLLGEKAGRRKVMYRGQEAIERGLEKFVQLMRKSSK